MMGSRKNYWGQHDIINKTKVLNKRGSYTIHDVITTKYHKYPFYAKLKHDNILDKVDKLPWGGLLKMMSHEAYSIQIHVCTMTLANINHKQKE